MKLDSFVDLVLQVLFYVLSDDIECQRPILYKFSRLVDPRGTATKFDDNDMGSMVT